MVYSLGDNKQIINQDYFDKLASLSATRAPQEWVSGIEFIEQAKRDLRYHLNKQLVIEDLLIKLNKTNELC